MSVTIIEGVGFKEEYCAIFHNDDLICLDNKDIAQQVAQKLTSEHGCKSYLRGADKIFKEFMCVNDFPKSLSQYEKAVQKSHL